MRFYWLVLGVLSVWRITHLLQAEDGPWGVVASLRRLAGRGFWGDLLDCFNCLSLWVAIPFALLLGDRWNERLLLWLALSAGAILLNRSGSLAQPAPPVLSKRKDSTPCCGKLGAAIQRQTGSSAPSRAGPGGSTLQQGSKFVFEYIGKTEMSLICPASGKHYYFAYHGVRIEVDSRDVECLASVPDLIVVEA